MVDIVKTLKTTVKKGKIKIGSKETKASIKNGEAKLVIIANNCPHSSDIKKISKKQKTPVYDFKLNSIDLGYAIGAILSGIIADFFGVNWAIICIGVITIFSSLIIKFRMPKQEPRPKK